MAVVHPKSLPPRPQRPSPARLPTAPGGPRGGGRITVPTGQGELLIDAVDVEWVAAREDQSVVHAGGKRYPIREPLATLEARLDPAQFVRVHRSAIVRLDQVRELRLGGSAGGQAAVVLRDGTRVPVSRRRLAQVKALL